jgi:gamma-glutamylcyclotransferase (GGCT)/AIG2-like uncharacterized protein YtfP
VSDRLLVYGTLRKGSRNSMHHMLANSAMLVGQARTNGRLYDLGEYPGLVPSSEPDAWVHGELYVLENAPEALARLDDYEGCGPRHARPYEFERVLREVVLNSGESCLAWVYLYTGMLDGKDEIPSGDYCR